MIKSVWLSNLIVSSLNDASSILYTNYKYLSRLINSEKCTMQLFEPDQSGITSFLISQKNSCIIPLESVKLDDKTIKKVVAEKTTKQFDKKLYCPLYCENIATFGVIVFNVNKKIPQSETLKKALLAFSTILYSESMGSIIKSFHDTAMSVKNVCVDYTHGKTKNRVINNVSLNICEKEFTIIEGASGSGKTTLLNVLGGMLKAAEGEVFWKDLSITDMTEKQKNEYRKNTVGFIFQRYNLIDELTAEENIQIAASLVKNPLPTEKVLKMVGLLDKAKYYPSQLSGGEQQRVCIARALVKNAKILLCDEPTGALDTENAKQIVKILKKITKNYGIPVVVITHNPNLVVLADHCITISNGMVSKDVLQPFALSAEEINL